MLGRRVSIVPTGPENGRGRGWCRVGVRPNKDPPTWSRADSHRDPNFDFLRILVENVWTLFTNCSISLQIYALFESRLEIGSC